MTALVLEGVSKTRGAGPHATRALSDVSLSVARGEVVLLEGPSGAGKTTRDMGTSSVECARIE